MKKLMNGSNFALALVLLASSSSAFAWTAVTTTVGIEASVASSENQADKDLIKAAKPDAINALAGGEKTEVLMQAVQAEQKIAAAKKINLSVEEAIKMIALSE